MWSVHAIEGLLSRGESKGLYFGGVTTLLKKKKDPWCGIGLHSPRQNYSHLPMMTRVKSLGTLFVRNSELIM